MIDLKKYEPLITAIILFIVFTFYDIIIVEYYLYTMNGWGQQTPNTYQDINLFVYIYQILQYGIIMPIVIGYTTIKTELKTGIMSVLLLYGGSLDILYYFLIERDKPMPDYLPWLWGGVLKEVVYIVAGLSLVLVMIISIMSSAKIEKLIRSIFGWVIIIVSIPILVIILPYTATIAIIESLSSRGVDI